MDERMRFAIRLKDGEAMAGLCREFGISRKTGYNQQLNSSEWVIYCDHSVTSTDVRLTVGGELVLEISWPVHKHSTKVMQRRYLAIASYDDKAQPQSECSVAF